MTVGPLRRTDVVVDPVMEGRRTIMDPVSRRYFRVGEREAAFYESLDGLRSAEGMGESNAQALTAAQVDTLLGWFATNGLLEGTCVAAPSPKAAWRRACGALLHPDRWRIRLGNPDAFLDRHRGVVDALFCRQAMGIYLLTFLAPILIAGIAPDLLREAASAYRLPAAVGTWVVIVALLLAMNVIHELAHAAACKHFGGRVHVIGVMFFYLYPVMYCDVSDAWRFTSRRDKVLVSLAGLFSQAVLAALATVAWLFVRDPIWLHFVAINLSMAVFNFFPFVKLDGYWMLVHAVDEPGLKQRGLEQLDAVVRMLVGRRRGEGGSFRPWIFLFGLGHALSLPAFWGMGIFALHRYGSMLSPSLGIVLATVASALVVTRAVMAGARYLGTLGRPAEVTA